MIDENQDRKNRKVLNTIFYLIIKQKTILIDSRFINNANA